MVGSGCTTLSKLVQVGIYYRSCACRLAYGLIPTELRPAR